MKPTPKDVVVPDDHNDWITIEGRYDKPFRVPLGNSHLGREGASLDICLSRSIDLKTELIIEISITTAGVVRWVRTEPSRSGTNSYWHFSREIPNRPPTPAQRAVLAAMWLGQIETPITRGGLGAPVCSWAFAGTTPEALAAEFGAACPALNGGEPAAFDTSPDRTPYHKGDNQP